MEETDGTHWISTAKSLLSIDRSCEFLAQSDWANRGTCGGWR